MKERTTTDEWAKLAWETYKEQVGGVAFNGDPLPTWEEMAADPNKEKLCHAWRMTALALVKQSSLEVVGQLMDVLPEHDVPVDPPEGNPAL